MTLDQLKYFYEAARLQHVGKAAKFVHISPSAISAAIASLESELNCKLFDRTGKSIILTDSGKKLKDEAEKLFSQIQAIKGKLQGKFDQLHGNFRLGASHFLSDHFLTRAWCRIQNKHPDLTGEIRSLPTFQVIKEVITGAVEIGLCFSPIQHPELKQIEVHRGKLIVVVRPGHPLLKMQGQKAISELSKHPAIIHKDRPGVELCEAHPIFARYGIVPKINLSFDSDACAIEKVAMSNAWTMIPDLVARGYSKRVKVISHPFDWDASYFIALVFRTDREQNPAIHAMQQELADLFTKK